MSEEIRLPALKTIIPLATEQSCISAQISYNLIGGSFSVTFLKDLVQLPGENAQFTLPLGRVGTVKSTGHGFSTGGLADTISGPAVPPSTTLPTLVGIAGNTFSPASALAAQMAQGVPVSWSTLDPTVKGFIFKGISLSGIQQLASFLGAEVVVNSGGIHVVDPGVAIGALFAVPKADVISASQSIDYSQDVPNVLNPALSAAQLIPEGDFVYDSDHAQKQGKTTVQAGAPGSQGSTDFIPIPDGWLVDGNFEEWIPPSTTDFTNPSTSANAGRYWKIFQSPTNPGMLRGILSFTRIVKEITLPGNVSSFVGSPVTGQTLPDSGKAFAFATQSTQSGIYGFTSTDVTFFDIISNQYYTFPNAIVLVPVGGGVGSGDASTQFYSITMELWTFPRVNPTIFPVGNPINPFNVPSDALIVNPPMNNVIFFDANSLQQYFLKYMSNFRRSNSPKLRTTVSVVFRGFMPQPGDTLTVQGVPLTNCGRVSSSSLSLSRGGLTLSITAEVYQFGSGLSGKYPPILPSS
jgi:hypothetical protein